MRFTYDPEVDILMVRLRSLRDGETVAATREISAGVIMDFDDEGNPLDIEILDAAARYGADRMAAYDIHMALLPLSEAAEIAGLSPTTLKLQIHNGKLQAKKVGRNWVTTEAWLREYLIGRRYNAKQAVLG
jgi:uncharacterized protein YuzE